jgi:hypothetical protein
MDEGMQTTNDNARSLRVACQNMSLQARKGCRRKDSRILSTLNIMMDAEELTLTSEGGQVS